jgi:beta-lactam-binding protein with PASTA domain
VPDYTGKDYADAVRGLKASGFSPVHAGGPLKQASSSEGMKCYLTHYRAVVRQQSPASGELRLGDTVDLTTRLASTTVRVTGHCIEP